MPKPERVEVDPNRNRIFVPGSGNMEMIGLDRAQMDKRYKAWLKQDVLARRLIASTWKCANCRQEFPGAEIRIKSARFRCPDCKLTFAECDGIPVSDGTACPACPTVLAVRYQNEMPKCPECEGPVVVKDDALNLRRMP